MALTARDIEFSPPGKLNDGDGLYLDKRSEKSASWLFRYTWAGKSVELGLGSLKKTPVEEARKQRAWCVAELAAGRNPKDGRQDEKAAKRAAEAPADPRASMTLKALVYANLGKVAPDAHSDLAQMAWRRQMSRTVGKLANMRPADITRADVVEVFQPLYDKTPVLAEMVRIRLAMVMRWARSTGVITATGWENPAEWRGNLEHWIETKPHTTKHHAALDGEDVPAFLAALRAGQPSIAALALEWVILSGCRAAEGSGARWDEIDLKRNCWVIPATRMKVKKHGAHRVPLTARHHEILAAVRLLKSTGEGVIFVSPQGPQRERGGHIHPGHLRLVAKAVGGKGAVTVHGFRASFATWARQQTATVDVGGMKIVTRLFPDELVEECLAHVVGSQARRAYIRDDMLEVRRGLMSVWAAHCGSEIPADETKLAA